MKYAILTFICILQGSLLFAQQEKRYIKKGNDLYQQQQYQEAEASYRKSFGKKNPPLEGSFNLGDALYKQKKYAEAGEQFKQIATAGRNNKAVQAQAYHNLGNTLLENKKLEESISAYKKSLISNPKDDQTRYNLAYAQQKLKQQQQKQQQKNNKNQPPKPQDQKDKEQKDKDKKDQDKKNDQGNQPKDDKGNKPEDQPDQPGQLSKEDARRMLDALNNQEEKTQDKLKNKKIKGEKVRIAKDW